MELAGASKKQSVKATLGQALCRKRAVASAEAGTGTALTLRTRGTLGQTL